MATTYQAWNKMIQQEEISWGGKKSLTHYQFQIITVSYPKYGPPLWSSGQSFWLQIQRSRVFLSSSGSGTGSTQPREPHEVN